MAQTQWASYESVQPPDISSDWFNKPTSLENIFNNPISQMYSDQVSIVSPKENDVYVSYNDKIEQEETNQKKSQKKRKQASTIVNEKISIPSSFQSNEQFAKVMNQLYKTELSKQNLDPSLSIMLVAQDALETAWGKSIKGKFNYGNITTNGNDWTTKTGNRKWKDFKSLEDYISYKVSFLNNNRYQFFTYATMGNVASSMQNLANRGYDPGNSQYGSRVADVTNTVKKYLS